MDTQRDYTEVEENGAQDGGQDGGQESVIQLHPANDDRLASPVVTPEPVPTDDMVLKLSMAGAAGAIVGSFVAWRWLRRHIVVGRR